MAWANVATRYARSNSRDEVRPPRLEVGVAEPREPRVAGREAVVQLEEAEGDDERGERVADRGIAPVHDRVARRRARTRRSRAGRRAGSCRPGSRRPPRHTARRSGARTREAPRAPRARAAGRATASSRKRAGSAATRRSRTSWRGGRRTWARSPRCSSAYRGSTRCHSSGGLPEAADRPSRVRREHPRPAASMAEHADDAVRPAPAELRGQARLEGLLRAGTP